MKMQMNLKDFDFKKFFLEKGEWVGLAVAVAIVAGCETEQKEQAELQAQAKVSKEQAQQTALAKAPGGTIKEGELEKEKGKLIWSFDIATPGTKDITEVHVDAVTGEVLGMEKETPKDEAKEKKGEKD